MSAQDRDEAPLRIMISEAAPIICKAFGADWDDVRKSRRYNANNPAHYVVYWAWKTGSYGTTQIAKAVGRDRTTLWNSIVIVEARLRRSEYVRRTYLFAAIKITSGVIARRCEAANRAQKILAEIEQKQRDTACQTSTPTGDRPIAARSTTLQNCKLAKEPTTARSPASTKSRPIEAGPRSR